MQYPSHEICIGANLFLNSCILFADVTKIVADGAVRALLEKNIKPDILMTDLDGDLKSIKKII